MTGFVSGIAFGNSVSFSFFSDPAAGFCAGTSVAKGTVAIVGTAPGIAHPSQSSGALVAGQYAFQASLASTDDYNINGATGTVVGACEPFSVDQGTSTTATTLHTAGHGVVAVNGHVDLGSVIHDLATVTPSGAAAPTGSVDFRFYSTGAACTADTTFTAGTTKGSVALTATAPYVAHPSTDSGALTPGTYAFRAKWAGDANYTGSTSDSSRSLSTRAT